MSDNDNTPLTQAEIDDLIVKIREEQKEAEAKRKLKVQNEAFDHFLDTGKVIPVPSYFDRFINEERVGKMIFIDYETSSLNEIQSISRANRKTQPVSIKILGKDESDSE